MAQALAKVLAGVPRPVVRLPVLPPAATAALAGWLTRPPARPPVAATSSACATAGQRGAGVRRPPHPPTHPKLAGAAELRTGPCGSYSASIPLAPGGQCSLAVRKWGPMRGAASINAAHGTESQWGLAHHRDSSVQQWAARVSRALPAPAVLLEPRGRRAMHMMVRATRCRGALGKLELHSWIGHWAAEAHACAALRSAPAPTCKAKAHVPRALPCLGVVAHAGRLACSHTAATRSSPTGSLCS